MQKTALLKKIERQIRKVESDDMYQLVTLTMPAALKIMRDEEFSRLDNLQDEGKEIARKGKLYTKMVGEGARLLKEEAEKIFADLKDETVSG